MVCENRIPDRDVSSNTLVETPVSEDTEGCCQMLFSVDSFFEERVELGV